MIVFVYFRMHNQSHGWTQLKTNKDAKYF